MPTSEELLQENSELRSRIAELEQRIEQQGSQIAQLEKIIEELRRGGKRQAAPFSKGEPKSHPQTPGRKPAERYGQRACRPVPEQVDETIEVGCPSLCEVCQSPVQRVGQESQYQIDIPEIRPWTTELILHYGECSQCGRRQVGRHPHQSSQAVGVAGVQIGPGAVSLATYLNKVGALSYGKIAGLLEQMAGLRVSRSTLCRALLRTALKSQPIYEELVQAIRESAVVYPDESGWRVGGRGGWLGAVTNRGGAGFGMGRGLPGRERLADRGAQRLAVGLHQSTGDGLCDCAGPWVRRSGSGAGRELCGSPGGGWVGALSKVPPSDPTDLPGPSAAAVSGDAGDRSRRRGEISPPSEGHSSGGLGGAGSADGWNPQPAGSANCQGAPDRPDEPPARRSHHPSRQSALGQALKAPPERSVRLLGPGGCRGHQLARRTGDPARRRQPQIVRRQPHTQRRRGPSHLDQPPADRSATRPQLTRALQHYSSQSQATFLSRPAHRSNPVNRYDSTCNVKIVYRRAKCL